MMTKVSPSAMSDNIPVEAWLAKPFWPWPVALAYSQAPDDRDEALFTAVEILELYSRIDSMAEYTGAGAIHRIYEAVTKEQNISRLEEDTMRRIEAALVGAIEAERVAAQGRKSPSSPLEPIQVSDWVGAEIDGEGTCDLVKAGWRGQSSSFEALFGDKQRVVWFYDVHLPRAGMLAVFGEPTGISPVAQPNAGAWSLERMKAEIASCRIGNRERAWVEIFKPKRKEHGWSNISFREVWSEGRNSKGTIGRPRLNPSKRA
ncbi:hypothetical protein U8326_16375 [Tsuneonella sp. CC-YZS046]|uniref:hypothetical protein n=1 Tax=Tsuneonella sp. CC-YZS046 TaxID=3042152 RepID=UPI002D779840|nr:hypothetical protein [Tsuneonella sp. CC-YZS046]WRO66585.1 hypothetical protein U8326_16375 [Tsuneonella sp. CC-YZS046]